jgi:hypothetical protein
MNIVYISEKAWKNKENPVSVMPKESLEIRPAPYLPISRSKILSGPEKEV